MGEDPRSIEGEKQVANLDRLSRKVVGEKVSFSEDLREVRERVTREGAVGAPERGSVRC